MEHNPKIFIEADSRGISKVVLEASGEEGLKFLKFSLPALRVFDSFMQLQIHESRARNEREGKNSEDAEPRGES